MKTLLLRPDEAIAWADGRKTRHTVVINRLKRGCKSFGRITEFGPSTTKGYDWHFRDKDGLWNDVTNERLMELCPHTPGDEVRLLTTWAVSYHSDCLKPTELSTDLKSKEVWSYFDSPEKPDWCGKLRPGNQLPTFIRHLMPETTITDVRAKELWDITEEEAELMGVKMDMDIGVYRNTFIDLWDEIHGHGAWERNDWVWVYTMEGPR